MQVQAPSGPANLYVMQENGSACKNYREFKHLRISGGSQFSEASLIHIINRWGKNATVFNLRQESNFYVNGHAIALRDYKNQANKGLNLKKVEKAERSLKRQLFDTEQVSLIFWDRGRVPATVLVQKIQTEKELIKSYGRKYVRYMVADQTHPSPKIVDDFVQRIRRREENEWFHFHCEAGWGRTTTFLFMVDAIHNAAKESFNTLTERQVTYGGCDLKEVTAEEKWKASCRKARFRFVKKFYKYCHDHPNFDIKFSDFNKSSRKKSASP